MKRRRFLKSAGAVATGIVLPLPVRAQAPSTIAAAIPKDHPLQSGWQMWKSMCLAPEGRAIDGFQNSDSHSEGQGYALTLAAAFDDIDAFEAIRAWTEQNLAIRPDALLAWRWRHDQRPHVPDRNNASDGDLFYAWALASMAARHGRPELALRAQKIATDLVRLCVVAHPDGSARQLLLPAEQGFALEQGFIINPSYTMPRALRDLAASTGVDVLSSVADDGISLMNQMAETGLVPDWATVDATGWTLPPGRFSANAGYEAMRVPLFAIWSGQPTLPAVSRFAAAATENAADEAATVFDRVSGNVMETSPHPGYRALASLASCAGSSNPGAAIPPFSVDQPYYPATLHLMSLVAQVEMYPRCVPI
jgi:endo-1,4-beta-D-glucanase Y